MLKSSKHHSQCKNLEVMKTVSDKALHLIDKLIQNYMMLRFVTQDITQTMAY